jgi:hypothetical protein
MGRYNPRKSDTNLVPEIKAYGISFKGMDKGRTPASLVPTKKNTDETENLFTNKKLYFLSLIDQYETLKRFSNKAEAPSVSICPNFHTGLITHYEKYNQLYNPLKNVSLNYSLNEIKNNEYLSNHPELYLPVSKESNLPRVVDIIKSNPTYSNNDINTLVQKAVDIHLTKTYYEISELCEYGVSDNYYIYENLITHIKTTNFKPSTENLNILLKSTVFANMAIINSLSKQTIRTGRSLASTNEIGNLYSNELLNKTNSKWADEYFNSLKK